MLLNGNATPNHDHTPTVYFCLKWYGASNGKPDIHLSSSHKMEPPTQVYNLGDNWTNGVGGRQRCGWACQAKNSKKNTTVWHVSNCNSLLCVFKKIQIQNGSNFGGFTIAGIFPGDWLGGLIFGKGLWATGVMSHWFSLLRGGHELVQRCGSQRRPG